MKFLVIRFSSIGDIVLTSPVVRCLKKQVENAVVHYLTKDVFRKVVEHNPYIDRVQVLGHSRELMIRELLNEDYDYIIDLHHNLRTLGVKKKLKKNAFSFYKLNTEKYLYTRFRINRLPPVHIVDRYLDTLESFGVKNDEEGLDYFIKPDEEVKKEDIPVSHQAGYIACAIGAGHFTKRWPVHKWKDFAARMEHPIVLLGGSEDAERGKEISSADPVRVYNACGKFSINESADIVKRSKLVISNDTGLMHIAAAYKRPVISLWGNTIPEFGMYPYYGKNFIDSQKELPYDMIQHKIWCRPCTKIGYKKCPLGHFKCMERIEVNEVIKRAEARLG